MATTSPKSQFNSTRLFGYDFFISFKLGTPPIGAQSYASDLARRLRELNFTVFYSEEEAPPGADLGITLIKALRRSKILVVLVNEGALVHSKWVRREVEEFKRKNPNRPVVPINFDKSIENYGKQSEVLKWLCRDDIKWLDESAEALNDGICTQMVFTQLQLVPHFTKANAKFIRLVSVIFLALIGLTSWAFWQKNEADQQALISRAQKLAAQARVHFVDQPDLADLLSNEASRLNDSVEVKASLLDNLEHDARLQTFLRGHIAPVRCMAFSQDGKILATSGDDHKINLWNTRSWQLQGTIPESHKESVWSLAFSPDSSILASGSTDKTVRLWNVATREPIGQALIGHTGPIRSIVFHPKENTLISSSATESGENETIKWDIYSQPPSMIESGDLSHKAGNLALSPNTRLLAIGRGQRSISLWDLKTNSDLGQQLQTEGVYVQSLAFSNDSKTLVASDDMGLKKWGFINGEFKSQMLSDDVDFINAVAISPDGKLLAGGGNDTAIHLWDLTTNKQIPNPLIGHRGYITSLAFHPDGTTLVSGSEDGTLIKWSLTPKSPIRHLLNSPGRVLSAAFSQDEHWFATGSAEGIIRIWDLTKSTLTPIRSIPTGRWINDLAFATDGNSLIACHDDTLMRLWDIQAKQPRERLLSGVHCDSDEGHQSLTRDGRKVFVIEKLKSAGNESDKSRTLTVWEISSDLVTPRSKSFTLSDVVGLNSSAISPDGKYFASIMDNGEVILWDLRVNPPVHRVLPRHNGAVTAVTFAPDGKILATGGLDATIRLWNVTNGELLRSPMQESDQIYHLVFNSLGTTLAVLYSRFPQNLSALHLWDVQSGTAIGSPLKATSPQAIGNVVLFSPTGRWVFTGGDEDNVVLWDMDLERWRAHTCHRANRNFHPTEEWPLYMSGNPYNKTCPELPLPYSIPKVIHSPEEETF